MFQAVVDRTHRLLRERTPDWSLDQPFYVDQDVFDLEMEVFFKRQWLFAALECEVPGVGDWTRVDIRWYVEEMSSALAPLAAAA